jgi:hypothetical protein
LRRSRAGRFASAGSGQRVERSVVDLRGFVVKRGWFGLALGAVVVSLAGVGLAGSTTAPAASGPCGTASVASVHYTHVLWIWMENHSYRSIIGSSSAPYINTLAGECGLATNYHNISHPSLPNYIGATSGLALSTLTPFARDCKPSPTCSTSAPSIFGQLASWTAYEESMTSNCLKTNSGDYYVRHNPPPTTRRSPTARRTTSPISSSRRTSQAERCPLSRS